MPTKPSETITRLVGWKLTPSQAYAWDRPDWHVRIGKVTPKREYIRYLVQRERDRRAKIAQYHSAK